MKKVIVRINDNYSIDQACAEILKLYGYLSFVEQFRSFQMLAFDCPAAYQSNLINQLRALNVVKTATWDKEVYQLDPMPEMSSFTMETSESVTLNDVGETTATSNTRSLTTSSLSLIHI